MYSSDEDAAMEMGDAAAEQNQILRQQLEANPRSFLRIPGLSHGDHHEILKDFVGSAWTPDEELRREAVSAYTRSIGTWQKRMEGRDDVLAAWREFKERAVAKRAAAFLRKNGIEAQWR